MQSPKAFVKNLSAQCAIFLNIVLNTVQQIWVKQKTKKQKTMSILQKIAALQTSKYRAPEIEDWNKLHSAGPSAALLDLDASVTREARSKVGASADMWSVGCILAELFLGRRLMTDDSQRTAHVCFLFFCFF